MRQSLSTFLWTMMKPQRLRFILIFLLGLAWAADLTIWPYLLRKVIDIMTAFDLNRALAWSSLKYLLLGGLGLWVFVDGSFRIQGFLCARAFPKLESDIRMKLFDHVQHHSPAYFNEHFAGSLSNKISDMTNNATLILEEFLWMILPTVAACVLSIFFLWEVNPLFAALIGGWSLLHFMLCLFFAIRSVNYQAQHGEMRSTLSGKIVDSFTNHFAVNLFFRFGSEREYVGRAQSEEFKAHVRAKTYVEWMRLVLAIGGFLIGFVLILGLMILFWFQGKLTAGEVAQIFNTNWNIVMALWVAGTSLPSLFQSIGIAKQAMTILQAPQDIKDEPGTPPLVLTEGTITFDRVSFHYGEKKVFDQNAVLIRGGERVGLVGYSGAGKTTFVNLIMRFFPVTEGAILIDGQPIDRVTLSSLRQQITLVPQEPMLFHRTLEENIRYGRLDATHEEVMEAARLAHCDEFIERLPQKYNTIVGERGAKLSGGERQRIAIARAFLSNSRIIILDEATSALDSVTEEYVQESLERLMKERTTLVIAHRLSTLAKMDRILVFDQGKIVEEGPHDKLLQEEGHYALIWNRQADGFLPA